MNLEKFQVSENPPQEGSVDYSRVHHPTLWKAIDFVCSGFECKTSDLEALAMEIYQSLSFDTDAVFQEWQEDGLFEEKTKYLQGVVKGFLQNQTKENLRLIVKVFE